VSGPAHANSGSFLEALAVAGLGIIFEPDFIVGPEVRAGRLVPILHAFAPPASGIHVVYPSRRHLSAKVRAFTDFLAQRFTGAEWALDAPPTAARAARRKLPRG
jgi:DNA-binding transcriptional LysR family regulator